MPLKNNKEREEYIRDDKNWIDHYYAFNYGSPIMKIENLKGTDIFRVKFLSIPLYTGDKPHYIIYATLRFNENGQLVSIYDLSINQLIDYLRKNKI